MQATQRERAPRRWLGLVTVVLTTGALLTTILPASSETSAAPTETSVLGTVSSGPTAATTPSGNATPERPAPAGATAPKETLSPSARATSNGPSSAKPASAGPQAPPAAQLSFGGTAQTQGLRPPDTHGAVGATQFVEVTNSMFEVFNKTGGGKTKSVTLNSFFGYATTTLFDPRVVYDKVWNRWVVIADAFHEDPNTQYLFMGVSTTSDATGAFCNYQFQAPRGALTNFYDYPMLGMDQDAVIITANIFDSSDVYQFTNMFAVAKADIYNCGGFSVPLFNAGASDTLAPPVVEGNANPVYFLASPGSGNFIRLYQGSNLGRSNAAFAFKANVSVPAFTAAPPARQVGTTDKLDVLNRFVDHSSQVGKHVVNVSTVSSIPTPEWWQINGGTNALVTNGFVFESGASDDWNPSVAASGVGGTTGNPIGRMVFTWSATQPSGAGAHEARVKAHGRLATDAVTITGGSTLATSATFYNPSASTVERWGDYSSVTIDPTPVAGCGVGNRFYVVNEKINSNTLWGSRWGRMGFC
jgi:hypothetical protein